MAALVYWLVRRNRGGKPTLLDPTLFASKLFSTGVFPDLSPTGRAGCDADRLADLPAAGLGIQRARRPGVTLRRLSLTMFGVALLAGRRAGRRRPSRHRAGRVREVLLAASIVILVPLVPRADSGWHLVIPLDALGRRARPASRPSSTTTPWLQSRRSWPSRATAGVTSATGSFGLSFGLAFAGAIMLGRAVGLPVVSPVGGRRGHRRRVARAGPLRATPATQGHARLPGDRIGDLRAVHGVHPGPEPRTDVARVASLPHADADLHRRLPDDVPASRAVSDVEPGRRGLVLRRVARDRLRPAARRRPSGGPPAS